MALIKCPECGREVSDSAIVCPGCGYPIQQRKENNLDNICPECGNLLGNDKSKCSKCGFELKPQKKKKQINTIVLAIFASILLVLCLFFTVLAYRQTHNSKYRFYKNHYEECMDGYRESEYNKSTSLFFGSTYDYISDKYLEMAREDQLKITFYVIKSVVFYFISVISLIGGILLFVAIINRSKKNRHTFTT